MNAVVARVIEAVRHDHRILFDEQGYSGTLGDYRFHFEGEDDLLHLIVERNDSGALTPEQAQHVVKELLPDLAPGVIFLKPGQFSQHFYLGHDELLNM